MMPQKLNLKVEKHLLINKFMMEKIKQLLNTKPGAVTIRFTKTFVYTALAFYVVNKTAPFTVDYLAMIEVSLLAGFGFGGDKYIRSK